MQQCVWLLLAVHLMSSEGAGQSTVCPIARQQFVSANMDLLPLSSVQTSSDSGPIFNPLENLLKPNTSPWCTTPQTNSRTHALHVTLNFTEPVRVSMIRSGGYTNGHVNNFTIEYTATLDDEDYIPFTASGTKYFHVKNLDLTDAYFILKKPIDAQRVRFLVSGDILDDSNRTCWELYLFGCALKDTVTYSDVVDVPVTSAPVSPPTSTPFPPPSPPPVEPSETNGPDGQMSTNDCGSSGLSQGEVLAIVVPVAVVTIIVTVVMVGVGVTICLACRRDGSLSSKEGGYETVTIKVLNSNPPEKPVQLYHPTPRRRIMSDVVRPVSTSSIVSRDSTNTFPGKQLYDVPRPLVYDVPRSKFRGRSSTDPTSMEFPNALYDLPPGEELNLSPTVDADYDEIPEDTDSVQPNNGRVKPPLPSPNKAVTNGVNPAVARGVDSGQESATVPRMYAKVNKRAKGKVVIDQPTQQ